MCNLFLSWLCLVSLTSAFAAPAAETARLQLEIEQVAYTSPEKDTRSVLLDLPRPSYGDVLFLGNGDKLTGTIINESLNINSCLGILTLKNHVAAKNDSSQEIPQQLFTAVVNSHLSGWIAEPIIQFKLPSGTRLEIKNDQVRTAVLPLSDTESPEYAKRSFVVLKNGDYFLGKMLAEQLLLTTPYAKIPLNLADTESITFLGGPPPAAKLLLRNHDQLQGTLEAKVFQIDLEKGASVKVFEDQLEVIYAEYEFVPDKAEFSVGGKTIRIGNRADDAGYDYEPTPGGLRIASIAPGSPYYGLLQAGDIVVAVNGKKYVPGTLTPLREQLVAGLITRILLTVNRGGQKLRFSIVK